MVMEYYNLLIPLYKAGFNAGALPPLWTDVAGQAVGRSIAWLEWVVVIVLEPGWVIPPALLPTTGAGG
jgi:hypothetical protein